MGWFFRKSISIGPIRLNLSRSGIGASIGVKGARLGVGPKGSYFQGGVGGVYYRQKLGSAGKQNTAPHPSAIGRSSAFTPEGQKNIESFDVSQLTDDSSESGLKELSRVQKYTYLFPYILGLALLLLLAMASSNWATGSFTFLIYIFLFLFFVPLLVYIRNLDIAEGTVTFRYDLEGDLEKKFNSVVGSFKELLLVSHVWHVEDSVDGKSSSGASTIVQRRVIRFRMATPPRVRCNINVPVLDAGQQILYFFPDQILVFESNGSDVGSISYQDLDIEVSNTRFVEHGDVPQDASRVDTAWQYVNKNGEPDRRFKDNRQIPIFQYEEMHLKSSKGLDEVFMFSKLNVAADFANSVKNMRSKSWDMHLGV